MSSTGKDILIRAQKKWRLIIGLEIFLFALGPAVLFYGLGFSPIVILVLFLVVSAGLILLKKPWQLTLDWISSYVDQRIKAVEYSAGLLLLPKDQLTNLALLQQKKVVASLRKEENAIVPVKHLKWSGTVAASFLLLGFLVANFGWFDNLNSSKRILEQKEVIIFQAVDSSTMKTVPPKLLSQLITISYPTYTAKKAVTTSNMNVKALEGSRLRWSLAFDSEVDSVFLVSNSNKQSMQFIDTSYVKSSILKDQGFYNFRFIDKNGGTYASELYALEVTLDQPPFLEIEGLNPLESFEHDQPKLLQLRALLKDDYGIADAQIIATVSKGSGESVKFREAKLSFDTKLSVGRKNMQLSKKIDLDQLKMEPGDELYFFVEVRDTKRPKANTSRSETFFAVIKDTVTGQFSVEGTMGADLMPDYFRSQRQLIIDTEKLIATQSKLTKQEFNATSNELGFDQKALRLKYGEFMGDEADSGIQGGQINPIEENTVSDDPIAEFTHDHDGANEHNLVDHEHGEEGDEAETTNTPLDDYLHDHDDPEASTLFAQSLKSKLQQAMAEMWDAELQLRLYTPKKSLPYQHKALKLIQDIKNSARIYVHRIGFDPPPIKEEVRLTGDISEVNNYQKKMELGKDEVFPHIRQATKRIEELLSNELLVTEADKSLFSKAGNELAAKALAEPGKYLKTLQNLKWLSEDTEQTTEILVEIQRGLLLAIPKADPSPNKETLYIDAINELLLKELDTYDR